MTTLLSIGLASAPDLSGATAALLRTDGEAQFETGAAISIPYSRDMKIFLNRAAKAAQEGRNGAADIGKAAGEFTDVSVNAVEALLEKAGIKRRDVNAIGYAGHTILHRPRRSQETIGRSWQIGDGKTLAEETRIDVVSDFTGVDIAEGAEGAPINALYVAARLCKRNPENSSAAILIGDDASVVYAPADASEMDVIACNAGPGTAMLDQWIELKTGRRDGIDDDALRRGKVHTDILRLMLLNPYLRRKPPKFLDNTVFKLDPLLHLSLPDGAATITALIAACLRAAEPLFVESPAEWVTIGGGARPAVMTALQKALSTPIISAADAGICQEFLAAESAAFLAVRSLRKLPITYPGITRAPRPLRGGTHWRAPL